VWQKVDAERPCKGPEETYQNGVMGFQVVLSGIEEAWDVAKFERGFFIVRSLTYVKDFAAT